MPVNSGLFLSTNYHIAPYRGKAWALSQSKIGIRFLEIEEFLCRLQGKVASLTTLTFEDASIR